MNSEEAQAKITRALRANGFQMRGDIWELQECGRVTETRNAERAVILEMDLPEGLKLRLDRFRKNPIVLFEHDYDQCLSIGRSLWERLRVQEGRDSYTLVAKAKFHLDTEISRTVWDRVVARSLRHAAPGVIPTAILETGGCARVASADLIEYSIMEAPKEPSYIPVASDKDELLCQRDVEIERRDRRIAELEEEIAEKQAIFAAIDQFRERMGKQLGILGIGGETCAPIMFIEAAITERVKLLAEKNQRIADLRSLITETHGALKNTTTRIERRLKELDI